MPLVLFAYAHTRLGAPDNSILYGETMLRLSLFAALLLSLLSACSIPKLISPYRTDVQQGNFVTQDAVDKLQVGMTRNQVKFLLGTPLIQDAFHTDRWDFTYQLFRDRKLVQSKHFTVYFKNDLVSHFEGDVMLSAQPADTEKPASAK